MDVSRRDLIKLGTTAAAASGLLAAQTAQAQAPASGAVRAPAPIGFNPADPTLKFDLVIANADVMDPSQRLRTRADLAVKNGQIAAITPGIAADRAVQRIDGGDGCSPPASSTSTRISCRISASACPRTSW